MVGDIKSEVSQWERVLSSAGNVDEKAVIVWMTEFMSRVDKRVEVIESSITKSSEQEWSSLMGGTL